MKPIQNLIIFFLCLCVVGFFANFAQNDYGLAMIPYAMLIIGVLMIELLRQTIIKYAKLGYSLYIMILFPVISMFIYVYNKGETYFIISSIFLTLGFLYNIIVGEYDVFEGYDKWFDGVLNSEYQTTSFEYRPTQTLSKNSSFISDEYNNSLNPEVLNSDSR